MLARLVLGAVTASVMIVPALAGSMNADEARRFVSGKVFAFTCFDGTRGAGRVLDDLGAAGSIQFSGSGPIRHVRLPGNTLQIRGQAVCASIKGLPFEKRDLYIERSPLYHVDKLNTPLLVHVATNDLDVNFVEDQQIVDALRSRKPDLAETKIYVDPPTWGSSGGHAFSRRVDPKTLQRVDSPEQIDSWNRTWVFFEWILRPYQDRSAAATSQP